MCVVYKYSKLAFKTHTKNSVKELANRYVFVQASYLGTHGIR